MFRRCQSLLRARRSGKKMARVVPRNLHKVNRRSMTGHGGGRIKVVIMGAAGRDFHNFNTFFRNNETYEVVAFTATQIPGIGNRKYPKELSGQLYPDGIPIYDESQLGEVVKTNKVDKVVFAYSDVSHETVMHRGSAAMALGADFWLMGPRTTQIKSKKPVVSVVAARTGCGKSQTSRQVVQELSRKGLKVVAIRHPMPYGDLAAQRCQRFASYADLDKHECTIEEREEYEPYLDENAIVYAGVDYGEILAEAEKEADVILWDGGNNDMSFYTPDVQVCVVDPHRPGHEMRFHPGETNVRNSDIVLIGKIATASYDDVLTVRKNVNELNPDAAVVEGTSVITVDGGDLVKDARVLVVEDGPTLTHGGTDYGVGVMVAKKFGAKTIVDPYDWAVGSILDTYKAYPHIGNLLPAMGYGGTQMRDLEETINRADADVVVSGTPIDLGRVINVNKPVVRGHYDLQIIGEPNMHDIIQEKLVELGAL